MDMKDKYIELFDAMIGAMEDVAPAVASVTKNLFDEYVKVGFTEEQALILVQNFSMSGK